MYESFPPTLAEPEYSSQPLWRYMEIAKLLDLFRTQELFFTHIPAFSDGLEGLLTDRSREHLLEWFLNHGSSPATVHEEVARYESHTSQFCANCWHMNDGESYLMWKAYADKGCAIRTTFERMRVSFDSFPGVITGAVINYVDFTRDRVPLGNVFTLPTTKDIPYRDEHEFRLMFWQSEPRNQSLVIGEKGVRIKVDVSKLIERVFISPFSSNIPEQQLSELRQHFDAYKVASDISRIKNQFK